MAVRELSSNIPQLGYSTAVAQHHFETAWVRRPGLGRSGVTILVSQLISSETTLLCSIVLASALVL